MESNIQMNIENNYDKNALLEISQWKNPKNSFLKRTFKVINSPLNYAGDLVLKTPVVGEVIQKTVSGLLSICNEGAQFSVRPNSIFQEFRDKGYEHIHQHEHIQTLNLEDVDKVIGWLGGKYKSLASVEGAATGATGIFGIVFDIPSLVTLNLRAIGEYATYYGYDINLQEERIFALQVLNFSSSPTDGAKNFAMANLVKISKQVAQKKTWQQLEKHAFVKLIQELAKSLGIRLTKAKLAQAVPALGAAVGAGFNAYFTNKTCDSAYYLYRERFLAEKYGSDIIK